MSDYIEFTQESLINLFCDCINQGKIHLRKQKLPRLRLTEEAIHLFGGGLHKGVEILYHLDTKQLSIAANEPLDDAIRSALRDLQFEPVGQIKMRMSTVDEFVFIMNHALGLSRELQEFLGVGARSSP
jgi:hypothetical protein